MCKVGLCYKTVCSYCTGAKDYKHFLQVCHNKKSIIMHTYSTGFLHYKGELKQTSNDLTYNTILFMYHNKLWIVVFFRTTLLSLVVMVVVNKHFVYQSAMEWILTFLIIFFSYYHLWTQPLFVKDRNLIELVAVGGVQSVKAFPSHLKIGCLNCSRNIPTR